MVRHSLLKRVPHDPLARPAGAAQLDAGAGAAARGVRRHGVLDDEEEDRGWLSGGGTVCDRGR